MESAKDGSTGLKFDVGAVVPVGSSLHQGRLKGREKTCSRLAMICKSGPRAGRKAKRTRTMVLLVTFSWRRQREGRAVGRDFCANGARAG